MSLSCAVSEIFYVECSKCALGIWVRGHWRSLKTAEFSRSDTTSYQSAGITIALACTIFWVISRWRISDIWITQGHWKWHHSIKRIQILVRFPLPYPVLLAVKPATIVTPAVVQVQLFGVVFWHSSTPLRISNCFEHLAYFTQCFCCKMY